MPRPPKFGPGEDCDDCVYFNRGYCTKYHWLVASDDWCSSYKAKPEHKAKFLHKEAKEKEEGKL